MHELYEELESICDILSDELAKTNKKLEKTGGELSAGDLDYVDKLTHALKSVKGTKVMMDSESDYSHMVPRRYSYDDMNTNRSYARGRGQNARRDSRGRYSSAYSMGGDMIAELRELMEDAPDERTRAEFERFIKKVEQM